MAGLLGELVQGGYALHPAALLEVDGVLESDPAMAVGLFEGDGSVIELDQGGTAHPEEVGRFLSGEKQLWVPTTCACREPVCPAQAAIRCP